MPELIYCAAGNKRFAEMAIQHGFTYGAQMPNTIYFKPEFMDQDWKKPDRAGYMNALAEYRPRLATVLDWEQPDQYDEVMAWAEEAAAYVAEAVIIIPKVFGGIRCIPERIGGVSVRLGYSVPTSFGGTPLQLYEFESRPVHLLGGSPHRQMRLSHILNTASADGNYMHKMATKWNTFWTVNGEEAGRKYWARLDAVQTITHDAPYEAFARSVENIAKAWKRLSVNDLSDLPLFA